MKQVNLGYTVIIRYMTRNEINIDTDIVNKQDAIDYAIDCLRNDVLIDYGYELDIENDIVQIEPIHNIVETQ